MLNDGQNSGWKLNPWEYTSQSENFRVVRLA